MDSRTHDYSRVNCSRGDEAIKSKDSEALSTPHCQLLPQVFALNQMSYQEQRKRLEGLAVLLRILQATIESNTGSL